MPDFVAYRGDDNPLSATQSEKKPSLSLANYLLHIAPPPDAASSEEVHAYVTAGIGSVVFGSSSAAEYGYSDGETVSIELISDVDDQRFSLEVKIKVNSKIVPPDYICIGMLLLSDQFAIGPEQGGLLPLLAHAGDDCSPPPQ